MAAATLPAYDMSHPHKPSKEKIAFGKFPPLEIDWKQNGNKRLQSFLLENLCKQKRLQSPNSGKRLETFSLTNQTMEKDWKLFHLQTKQWKTIGNNGKPHGKNLQTLEIVDRLF